MRSRLKLFYSQGVRFIGRYERVLSVGLFLLIIAVALYYALNRIIYSDFYPINGDFQNYNGIRRLLSGQIPFSDFYFYLGLGPLYLNSIPLLLFDNNFTNSLFFTYFITPLLFAITIYLVIILNGIKRLSALALTFLIMMAAAGFSDFMHLIDYFQRYDFIENLHPGNSIRPQRIFIIFFISIIYLLSSGWIAVRVKSVYVRSLLTGALIGAGVAWSNDFGISAFLAGSFIFILSQFRYIWLEFAKRTILFLLGAIVSCFTFVSILTVGNFWSWFHYNFLGVAAYQSWYYERTPLNKLLVLNDLPINFEIVCSVVLIIYMSMKLAKNTLGKYETVLLFLFLSSLIGGYAYAYTSHKSGLFTSLQLVFYISVFCFVIKKIYEYRTFNIISQWFIFILCVSSMFIICFQLPKTIDSINPERQVYVPELNGYLTNYGDDLNIINQKINPNETVFSTYASALETVQGKFQPTGIDYIIHVLGDDYRKKYIDYLVEHKPRYVTTIREDFTYWEVWAKRANWFFYREILMRYRPIFMNTYNVIWEINDLERNVNNEGVVNITRLSDNQFEIEVSGIESGKGSIAEISITYKSVWNNKRILGWGINKIVNISDGWSSEQKANDRAGNYNLPEELSEARLPVKLVGGAGKLNITSYPQDLTELLVENVQLINVLPDVEDLLDELEKDSLHAANLTDSNWTKGISNSKTIILMKNNVENLEKIKDAKILEAENGGIANVIRVDVISDDWIHISVANPVDNGFEYPFQLKVIQN
ncbi:hypothetical protein PAECIP111893_00429 [Paenibacillus plantiphilus]|uniref:Archaeal glycosylation protein B peripheral domain-containing protein n=1 Tax=Paenibacillus plantiphilus TaxID=2905650 RepID=A0ABN8FVP8_9BACL|nr:hypothetical protein [Paenibacillus plantiphilus]CAH1193304.1 hypothetical protein PAECIP111893_00429 [Paenibacillus plantiphilus]